MLNIQYVYALFIHTQSYTLQYIKYSVCFLMNVTSAKARLCPVVTPGTPVCAGSAQPDCDFFLLPVIGDSYKLNKQARMAGMPHL